MDEQINDGGPVYPQGMSLRDWFAGQALAFLAQPGMGSETKAAAEYAYEIADAMIAVRKTKETNQCGV